eukprot:681844-Amphidinium_carterae.1
MACRYQRRLSCWCVFVRYAPSCEVIEAFVSDQQQRCSYVLSQDKGQPWLHQPNWVVEDGMHSQSASVNAFVCAGACSQCSTKAIKLKPALAGVFSSLKPPSHHVAAELALLPQPLWLEPGSRSPQRAQVPQTVVTRAMYSAGGCGSPGMMQSLSMASLPPYGHGLRFDTDGPAMGMHGQPPPLSMSGGQQIMPVSNHYAGNMPLQLGRCKKKSRGLRIVPKLGQSKCKDCSFALQQDVLCPVL